MSKEIEKILKLYTLSGHLDIDDDFEPVIKAINKWHNENKPKVSVDKILGIILSKRFPQNDDGVVVVSLREYQDSLYALAEAIATKDIFEKGEGR